MPYVDTEWRLQVRGNAAGGEIWVNTWTFRDTVGSQDVQEVGDILHALYEDWYASATYFTDDVSAVGCTAKNLATDELLELDWITLGGINSGDNLPTQLACRVSLKAGAVHGGPFITGMSEAALGEPGNIVSGFVTHLIDGLETFTAALGPAGWELVIDRPSVLETVAVTSGRVGARFDVIRRRANDLSESYTSFTV